MEQKYFLINDNLEGGVTQKRYAVYLVPNLNKNSSYFLKNCNKLWGGMHITLAGFSNNHPPLKSNMRKASVILNKIYRSKFKKPWKINIKKIKVSGNKIYIKSKSLDLLSSWFRTKGFQNIKKDFHITSEDCKIPKNVDKLLENLTWSLCIIELGSIIKWHERYILYI